MNTLLFIGLIVIAIAWIIQLITAGKSKNLSIGFVCLYFIGVVLLAIGNFGLKSNAIAILNIVLAILALLTVIFYPKKKAEKK